MAFEVNRNHRDILAGDLDLGPDCHATADPRLVALPPEPAAICPEAEQKGAMEPYARGEGIAVKPKSVGLAGMCGSFATTAEIEFDELHAVGVSMIEAAGEIDHSRAVAGSRHAAVDLAQQGHIRAEPCQRVRDGTEMP